MSPVAEAQASPTKRRADIDSLRVLVLLLLIAYHTLLIYAGHQVWRVTSIHHGYWADYLIGVLTPWRMAMVFFVGGVAVRFMLKRTTFGAFVRERATKLLGAFVFAVIVIAPWQDYVRLDNLNPGAPVPAYVDYLIHQAPTAGSYMGVPLPDFAHVWFLPYLFVYSALIAALWRYAPNFFRQAQGAIEQLPVLELILFAAAWIALLEAVVFPTMPTTGVIYADLSGHMKYIPPFFVGVLLGDSEVFRDKLAKTRTWLWPATLGLMLAAMALEWSVLHQHLATPTLWHVVAGAFGGLMLFALADFASVALNTPTALLSYASDAILPVYLMHQTTLVVAADAIVDRHWPLIPEFVTLVCAAGLVPLIVYHVLVRRQPWLRVLVGLRPRLRD